MAVGATGTPVAGAAPSPATAAPASGACTTAAGTRPTIALTSTIAGLPARGTPRGRASSAGPSRVGRGTGPAPGRLGPRGSPTGTTLVPPRTGTPSPTAGAAPTPATSGIAGRSGRTAPTRIRSGCAATVATDAAGPGTGSPSATRVTPRVFHAISGSAAVSGASLVGTGGGTDAAVRAGTPPRAAPSRFPICRVSVTGAVPVSTTGPGPSITTRVRSPTVTRTGRADQGAATAACGFRMGSGGPSASISTRAISVAAPATRVSTLTGAKVAASAVVTGDGTPAPAPVISNGAIATEIAGRGAISR